MTDAEVDALAGSACVHRWPDGGGRHGADPDHHCTLLVHPTAYVHRCSCGVQTR